MKHKLCTITFMGFLVVSLTSLPVISEEQSEDTALKAEAISIVKKFGGTLKPLLTEAIQSGGLSHAINICSIEAPRIADNLSQESGWIVKRVSLKPRNSKSATADPFERKVLEQFNERQVKGESADTMAYSERVDNQFRFMKAQGVEGICLNCHGETLSADVKNALKKNYPEDIAKGYSQGQIRGAFSLIKDIK